ncbi:MAG TPA: MarR family transcriptional regulator [Polyangia bacterium]|nr:MarR family transcriptional regulator [Polyangia bacterium]
MSPATDFNAFVTVLREVMFALRAISNELLADLGCTTAERGVLDDLDHHGPLTVPDLAEARAVARQTMQKTIDRLAERGWVVARPNPRHQRSVLLELTPAGRRLLAEVHDRERRLVAATPLGLSGAELRRTTASLRTLQERLAARTRALS